MELSMALEAEFGAMPSDILTHCPTLDALVDYCAANQGGARPRRPEASLDVNRYPVRRRWYHRALFAAAKRWCLHSLDFRVEGLENLVPGRQYIFCPNHAANFDGLFVLTALERMGIDLDRFGSLSKQELAHNPFTSLIVNTAGSIPVDRFGDTLPSVHRAIDFIREGGSLMIFPEGTRTRDGSLGRFHEGAAYIALSSGMTIIPTAIIGSYKVFPHSRKLPQARDPATGQRYRVTVCFCPEVETAGRSEREITEAVRRAIEERLGREEGK
jgi:1-acyl-sn-glycerol-3-phosphate acyltransferase